MEVTWCTRNQSLETRKVLKLFFRKLDRNLICIWRLEMLSQLIAWLRQRTMDKLGFLCFFFLNKESNNPTTNWRAWNSKEFPPKHEEILCWFLKQAEIQNRKNKRTKKLKKLNTLIKLDLKEELKKKPSNIKGDIKKTRITILISQINLYC